MTEAETLDHLRRMLDELGEAGQAGRHRFPASSGEQHDRALAEALERIDHAESATPRSEYGPDGALSSHDVLDRQRDQARQAHRDAAVADRESGRQWERRALEARQQRKRVADLRKLSDRSPEQGLELASAEQNLRRARLELALGRSLGYRDEAALALAQRRGGLHVLDEKLNNGVVEDALKSGPLPVDAAELLGDEERERALLLPTPA